MFWESESEISEEKKYTLSPFENVVEQKTIWLALKKDFIGFFITSI